MLVYLDVETYSEIDLKACGLYVYASHPSTDVLCVCWHVDHPEGAKYRLDATTWRGRWLRGDPPPKNVLLPVANGYKVVCHNVAFDAEIWRCVLAEKYGWWWPGYDSFLDSMAQGMVTNLPGKLEQAAIFMGTSEKDMAGARLMKKLCKPARMTINLRDEKRLHTPENIAKLADYCQADVEAERGFSRLVPSLSKTEERIWRGTWGMNRHGVRVDVPLVLKCLELSEQTQARYRDRLSGVTGGDVQTETQRARLAAFLEAHGASLPRTEKGNPSFGKDTAELIDMENADEPAQEAFALYKTLNKSSVAKFKKMMSCLCGDGRIRGMFCYSGAGQTGRDAGRDVQLQNLPRGIIEGHKGYAFARDLILRGTCVDELELLYGNAMDALSSLIRVCLIPAPGKVFVCADYSAIEGRVLAWMAGEDHILQAYREGRRMYAVAAAAIFGCSYEQVLAEKEDGNSFKDKVGKVSELACLAEGTPVLTLRGEVPVEQVLPADLVWDGLDWVAHEGIVCHGIKETMTYGPLCATPDHLVWIEGEPKPVALRIAASRGARLLKTGLGRSPLRLGGDNQLGSSVHAPRVAASVYPDALHGMRERAMDLSRKSDAGVESRVPALQPAKEACTVAGSSRHRGETALHESEGCGLSKLRCAGYNLRLPVSRRGLRLDNSEPGVAQKGVFGPYQQRQGIRAGEPSVGDSSRAEHEYANVPPVCGQFGLGGIGRMPVRCAHRAPFAPERDVTRGDNGSCVAGSGAATEKLARDSCATRVYDIVNAGPRHRFTAAGVLVHNCGYQGNHGAFKKMGGAKLGLSRERIGEIVQAWRQDRRKTKQFWYGIEAAALEAMRRPMQPIDFGMIRFGYNNDHLKMQLPSGRCLWYRRAQLGRKVWDDGRESPQVKYYGVDDNKRVGWIDTYGGKLTENAVQAISRDILMHAALNAEAEGWPMVMRVHDEIVAEVDEGTRTHVDLCALMRRLPDWAAGLPIDAAGWTGDFYRKG